MTTQQADWLQQAVDAANAQSIAGQPVTISITIHDNSRHDNRVVNVYQQTQPERRLTQTGQCSPSRLFHPLTGRYLSEFATDPRQDLLDAAGSGAW